MSKSERPRRLCLVGATGLVGMTLIERTIPRSDERIVGVARREVELPFGARMEMLLADPSAWPDAIAASNCDVLVCALGTTMKAVGGDRDAFRMVDYDLVLSCARAAKDAGIGHMVVLSSVGADAASKNFYLRVKGEMETALAKIGLRRLDIVRPGLIVGPRRESRLLERLGMWFAPLVNLFLHGKRRKYRSIRAETLADAILALSMQKPGGRFVHEFDAMHYIIRRVGGDK